MYEYWCGLEHGWLISREASEVSGLSYRAAAHRWDSGRRGLELITNTNSDFSGGDVVEIEGEKKTIREWAREKQVSLSTVTNRYYSGIRGAEMFEYKKRVRRTRIDESGKFSVNTGKNWEPAADVAKRAGVDEHEILRRAKSKCPARAIGMEKMAYAELMSLRDSREKKNALPVGWGGIPKKHRPASKLKSAWF